MKGHMTIGCGWSYKTDGDSVATCPNELTPKEILYCKKYAETFDGKLFCYGHQKQYIVKYNKVAPRNLPTDLSGKGGE